MEYRLVEMRKLILLNIPDIRHPAQQKNDRRGRVCVLSRSRVSVLSRLRALALACSRGCVLSRSCAPSVAPGHSGPPRQARSRSAG